MIVGVVVGGIWCEFLPVVCPQENQFAFPLGLGIPVSSTLGILIEENTKSPFLWLVGQFVKFSMRLSTRQKKLIEDEKKLLGITGVENLVGSVQC